jgi:hypothetical protein
VDPLVVCTSLEEKSIPVAVVVERIIVLVVQVVPTPLIVDARVLLPNE